MQSLPSHRQALTSLIDTLSTATTTAVDEVAQSSQPRDRRRLLLTLHVLFPTLLLPALDLLDRHLVTKLSLNGTRDGTDAGHQEQEATGSDGMTKETQEPGSPALSHQSGGGKPEVYLVRSVASTLTRRTRDALSTSSSSQTYLVRLDAWHCSCATFALEAFPARTMEQKQGAEAAHEQLQPGQHDSWSFGGQRHGSQGGNAPCCKHLLACLLAQRCSTMMKGEINTRLISKEEFAGITADI